MPSDTTPIGGVIAFGGTTDKLSGNSFWLLCDGGSYPTDGDYKQLFDVIGYTYGGSGASFNVPDYRGYFLRGVSAGSNVDPDAAARTLLGSAAANGVGTTQDYATALPRNTATHPFLAQVTHLPSGEVGVSGETTGRGCSGGVSTIDTCTAGGDGDTRPVNVYVYFYIKARDQQ